MIKIWLVNILQLPSLIALVLSSLLFQVFLSPSAAAAKATTVISSSTMAPTTTTLQPLLAPSSNSYGLSSANQMPMMSSIAAPLAYILANSVHNMSHYAVPNLSAERLMAELNTTVFFDYGEDVKIFPDGSIVHGNWTFLAENTYLSIINSYVIKKADYIRYSSDDYIGVIFYPILAVLGTVLNALVLVGLISRRRRRATRANHDNPRRSWLRCSGIVKFFRQILCCVFHCKWSAQQQTADIETGVEARAKNRQYLPATNGSACPPQTNRKPSQSQRPALVHQQHLSLDDSATACLIENGCVRLHPHTVTKLPALALRSHTVRRTSYIAEQHQPTTNGERSAMLLEEQTELGISLTPQLTATPDLVSPSSTREARRLLSADKDLLPQVRSPSIEQHHQTAPTRSSATTQYSRTYSSSQHASNQQRRRQGTGRTILDFHILNLCIADLWVSVVHCGVEGVWRYFVEWPGGEVLCKLIAVVRPIGLFAVSFIIASIALDRLIAVTKPLSCLPSASRRARYMIRLSWFLGLACSLPQAMYFKLLHHPYIVPEFHQCRFVGTNDDDGTNESDEHNRAPLATYAWLNLTTLYYIPMAIIIVCYSIIFLKLRYAAVRGRYLTSQPSDIVSAVRSTPPPPPLINRSSTISGGQSTLSLLRMHRCVGRGSETEHQNNGSSTLPRGSKEGASILRNATTVNLSGAHTENICTDGSSSNSRASQQQQLYKWRLAANVHWRRQTRHAFMLSVQLVGAFIVCTAPYALVYSYYLLAPDQKAKQLDPHIREVLLAFSASNSIINPILYGRHMIWSVLCGRKHAANLNENSSQPRVDDFVSCENGSANINRTIHRTGTSCSMQSNIVCGGGVGTQFVAAPSPLKVAAYSTSLIVLKSLPTSHTQQTLLSQKQQKSTPNGGTPQHSEQHHVESLTEPKTTPLMRTASFTRYRTMSNVSSSSSSAFGGGAAVGAAVGAAAHVTVVSETLVASSLASSEQQLLAKRETVLPLVCLPGQQPTAATGQAAVDGNSTRGGPTAFERNLLSTISEEEMAHISTASMSDHSTVTTIASASSSTLLVVDSNSQLFNSPRQTRAGSSLSLNQQLPANSSLSINFIDTDSSSASGAVDSDKDARQRTCVSSLVVKKPISPIVVKKPNLTNGSAKLSVRVNEKSHDWNKYGVSTTGNGVRKSAKKKERFDETAF